LLLELSRVEGINDGLFRRGRRSKPKIPDLAGSPLV